jgi:hypothetical protein
MAPPKGFRKEATGSADKPDSLCPRGYRFLVQSNDFATEGEFREWLIATFGAAKGKAACIVKGFHDPGGSRDHGLPIKAEKWYETGFRAYLPRKP